jgi:hypothetical protein
MCYFHCPALTNAAFTSAANASLQPRPEWSAGRARMLSGCANSSIASLPPFDQRAAPWRAGIRSFAPRASVSRPRRRTNFPPGGPTTNLSWRNVLPYQPWLINILTDNHTEALCLLAAELVFLGEQLSRHRIQNKQPADTLFRATIARIVFHQFYARSMLREQFEVTQSTAAPVLRREE